jgi:outer membrane protein assembly factor BamD
MAVAVAVGVTGCATPAKRQLREVQAYQERPVEVLYNLAASMVDYGYYDEAIQYFREVERQHPYSEWARRSIMMEAYSAYRMGDYDQARNECDRFAQLYPGNPSAPYAYYLKGLTYFDQIVDVGRDQGSTEQAQSVLREVIRRFPNTNYARDAQLKLDLVDNQLAGKDMSVGRFYQKEGRTIAALNRFKNVVNNYQRTPQIAEALYRMVEVNLTLGLVDEAQRNAAVLGANYPGSSWYADAYNLMTGRGRRPAVAPIRRLRNGFGLFGGSESAPPAATPEKGQALPPPPTS